MSSASPLKSYLVAVVASVLAVCARIVLAPSIGASFPYAVVLVVVLLVGARYGLGPALTSAAVGGLGSIVLVPPFDELRITAIEEQVGYGLYWVVAVIAATTAGATRDARQRAEDDRDRLRTTLEGIGDGVFATDGAGRISMANPTARAMIDGVEPVGRPIGQVVALDLQPVLEDGGRVERDLVLLGRQIEATATPIRSEQGGIRGSVVVLRDVTGARAIQRQLDEQDALFRSVLDHSPAQIYARDLEGRYLLLNEALAAFAGRPAQEILGRTDAEVFPPDVATSFLETDRAVIESGEVRTYEKVVETSDGVRRWLTTKFPLVGADGALYGVCGVSTEVTSLRRVEQALRDSEERLRLALEAGRMSVWDWNVATGALAWSDTLEAIHGLARGAFGGTLEALLELVHPDDRGSLRAAIDRATSEGEPYDLEHRVVRPDRSVRWIAEAGRVFTDARGQPARLLGVGLDVTDRRQVEDAMRSLLTVGAELGSTLEVVELLDRLIGGAAALVGATSGCAGLRTSSGLVGTRELRDGRYGPLDETWAPGEGRPGRLLVHPVPQEEFDPRLGSTAICLPLLGADEVIGFVEVRGSSFSSADRARLGGVARTAGLALHNALAYRELQQVRGALEEADRRKDHFLAILAHELRNPLASIRHSVELLRRRPDDASIIERAAGVMERQVGQLVRLIDDLMDTSRITRDRLALRRAPVQLSAVIDSALEATGPMIEEAGHRLTVALPPGPVWLDADPTRLAQVVSNLLSNAARYTPHGGQISLEAEASSATVQIRVRDTGRGIQAEQLPRLFDGYAAAEASSGLGLGLSLVRWLVERHGGRVEAYSEGEGRGSTFVVTLPLGRPPSGAPQSESAPQPDRRQVLVVDDNEDAADSLASLLRMAGQEVAVAHDGVEGHEMEARLHPDLVLLDIGMPRMDGYEAAKRIRSRGDGPVLVALTGWGQEQDRARAAEAGFDRHLTKPVDPDVLLRLIADVPKRR